MAGLTEAFYKPSPKRPLVSVGPSVALAINLNTTLRANKTSLGIGEESPTTFAIAH